MKYLIPKEIKAKPKLFGLGLKECVILLVGYFSIFTFLKDLVYSSFSLPFILISGVFLFWIVLPSPNNRGKQNYESLFLLFKRTRIVYHPVDTNKASNELLESERG